MSFSLKPNAKLVGMSLYKTTSEVVPVSGLTLKDKKSKPVTSRVFNTLRAHQLLDLIATEKLAGPNQKTENRFH